MLQAALVDGVLVGFMKIVPTLAHLQVGHGELPMLGWILEPFAQPLGLFCFADVEEEFQPHHAVVGEQLLESLDLFVARPPDFLRLQSQHSHDEDVFIV